MQNNQTKSGTVCLGRSPILDILFHSEIIAATLQEVDIENLPCRTCPFLSKWGQVELESKGSDVQGQV